MRNPVLLAALLLASPLLAQRVTPPDEHLGRPVGIDFELADWSEVSGYFRLLASQSPRVLLETVGTTTEGREFLLATISSEENLASLDGIRDAAARIADPRGLSAEQRRDVLDAARPILFVSCAMHSTETAAPQFGMELAYRLATSDAEPWRSARRELVVVLFPTLNPDGLDHVVSWYRETVGTPHEGAGLLKLYQYYAGHDNNRDWFMLTQNETRIVTEQLYSVWHPHVYWDVHQQGGTRERMFIPPFRDPLNPNLDSGIIAGIDALGSRALFDMTREGLTGISTGVTYDMWWNGGNRNVPVRHNVIGLLTEAASVNLASPVFLEPSDLEPPRGLGDYVPSNRFPEPWPGGWWRLRDIIDYELSFGRSLLRTISSEPRVWLENAMEAAQRAIDDGRFGAPRAWVIPSDNRDRGAVRRLVDTLLVGGVELFVSDEPLDVDGRRWPAGSIVIPRAQPYGAHVKDLFEVQRYPEGDPPYDVAGWTLPFLLGVHRVEVMSEVPGPLRRVFEPDAAVADFADASSESVWSGADSATWPRVFAALDAGQPLSLLTGPAGEESPPAGSFALAGASGVGADRARVELASLPRVGLYTPWSGSMNEGWMRWVFDTFELPYVRVRNEMLRAGELGRFLDVLVLPNMSERQLDEGRAPGTVPDEYTRGLDPEGAVAVEEFVRGGGTLVAMSGSAEWAIELFQLPIEDVARGEGSGDFACPGSVLRTVPEPAHAATAGLPDSIAVFFSSGNAWSVAKPDERKHADGTKDERAIDVLLRYAPSRLLLSGWIREPEVIEGRAAWVRARHGEGAVHLFGFRPQYRGWSQASFPLLFRAILLGGR